MKKNFIYPVTFTFQGLIKTFSLLVTQQSPLDIFCVAFFFLERTNAFFLFPIISGVNVCLWPILYLLWPLTNKTLDFATPCFKPALFLITTQANRLFHATTCQTEVFVIFEQLQRNSEEGCWWWATQAFLHTKRQLWSWEQWGITPLSNLRELSEFAFVSIVSWGEV